MRLDEWTKEQHQNVIDQLCRPSSACVSGSFATMRGMDIRIAIDFGQKGEEGVPVKVKLLTDPEEKEVPIYTELRSEVAVEQPYLLKDGGGRIFIEDGGKFKAIFTWTASDGKERTFPSEFEIPQPPTCPRCEQRVPELSDYICDECRFGV